MSDVTTELAMEASDKAMEIARIKAENDRLREERDMYRDFSCNVGRYVGLRQGEYWERTENSNYYCGGCGWKVTDHDSYCPECGGALHNATLGSCNCPNNCTNGERTETCADGGTVSETYIRPTEEGSICPIPRASVIFEGQKLTFDEEDSARFTEIVKRHLRKLAGLEVEQ